jgi:NAD(P)-dependent dehydrogenase (short-subunit alcohol dehydrogenase family)
MGDSREQSSGLRTYSGAVVVITGGASGIGAALSRALSRRGASIVIADRQAELAQQVAHSLQAAGTHAEAHEIDVRDAGALESLIDGVFRRFGRLDFLFNNAGTGVGGEALDYQLDDWRHVIDVNLMGVAYGVHAAYPRMVKQGFGHIVNTASMAGLMPTPATVSYGASKHAVVGLSRSLRVEGSIYGVRVSVLCPGVIRTPLVIDGGRFGRFTRPVPTEVQAAVLERTRPMDPGRFAEKVVKQVAANKEIIIVPAWWKTIWWLNRLSPTLGTAFALRAFRDVRQAFESATAKAGTSAD